MVYAYVEGDRWLVFAFDPMLPFAVDWPELRPLADEVRGKLSRVLERL
jgi:hypothetical protein